MGSRINFMKMAILPKAFYKFNKILIIITIALYKVIRKRILRFIWKYKKSQIVK